MSAEVVSNESDVGKLENNPDISVKTTCETSNVDGLPFGPQAGVSYPLCVVYCGECSMPLEVKIFVNILLFVVFIYPGNSTAATGYNTQARSFES